MFDHKGVIRVPQHEFDASMDPLEVAIEVGAEEVQCDRDSEGSDSASNLDGATDNEGIGEEQFVRFLCNPSELSTVSKALKSLGYVVAGASLEYVPKLLVHLSQGSYDSAVRLVCALSEHSDVTEVYDNFALK
jgi:transcriptional/translational regulatory protein YebC/TACO1